MRTKARHQKLRAVFRLIPFRPDLIETAPVREERQHIRVIARFHAVHGRAEAESGLSGIFRDSGIGKERDREESFQADRYLESAAGTGRRRKNREPADFFIRFGSLKASGRKRKP